MNSVCLKINDFYGLHVAIPHYIFGTLDGDVRAGMPSTILSPPRVLSRRLTEPFFVGAVKRSHGIESGSKRDIYYRFLRIVFEHFPNHLDALRINVIAERLSDRFVKQFCKVIFTVSRSSGHRFDRYFVFQILLDILHCVDHSIVRFALYFLDQSVFFIQLTQKKDY